MKTLLYWIIFIIILLGISWSITQLIPNEIIRIESGEYSVKISNWFSSISFTCQYYERNENVYKFFDADSMFLREVSITDGYVIQIKKR